MQCERCALCCDYSHQFLDSKRTVPNPDCWKGDDPDIKNPDDAIRYYRMNGECIPCPENPWMLIGLIVAAGGAW